LKVEIKVPPLSESLASGTLLAWRKQVGEQVLRDETLVDLETDKVILEIPAAASGTLLEIRQPEGAEVKSDQVVAVIETQGNATSIAPPSPQPPKITVSASPSPPTQTVKKVAGTTPKVSGVQAPAATPQTSNRVTQAATPLPPAGMSGNTRREKMSRLRSRIAERLLDAQHTAAMLTTFNEVNMQPVNELRQRYKAEFEIQHGVKLGYMSFFVRAVCVAMQQFPVVNAAIDGDEIVWSDDIDIGIAVSTPRGLVVPILRQAQTKSAAMIETAIENYADAAELRDTYPGPPVT